jgi:hypothetical protein
MGSSRRFWPSLFAVASLIAVSAGPLAADEPSKAPVADGDGWYSLFDGKSLAGWTPNENKSTWSVKDGELIAHGDRSHLFYTGDIENHHFKNFELKLEVKTKPQSNSGVYVHTEFQKEGWPAKGLEVQVNNTHPDPRKTASLYRLKDVMNDSPAKDGEWFTLDITIQGKHAVVKVNGKVANEYTQPDHPEHEAGWEHNELQADGGAIAVQGHDPTSEVHYRNIRIKPLP